MSTAEELLEQIDKATEDDVLTKKEALEVLETIAAGLDSRIEALESEIEEEDAEAEAEEVDAGEP